MSTRRGFLVALGVGLLTMSVAAPAQESGKVYRIGFLGARFRSTPANPDIYYDSFVSAMRDLGYVEGENLFIEWRFAENHLERFPTLAAELAGMKLDAIVTHGLPSTVALQKATSTIPIVFAAMVDPAGSRVVQSLARPGGNTTGISLMSTDVSAKRLELLKQIRPALSRVAVLVNPGVPPHAAMLKNTENAAAVLGIRVLRIEANNADEIERALDRSVREHTNGLIVLDDATFNGYRGLIARLALDRGLSLMGPTREFVEAGALVCYGMSTLYCYRRAAVLVDKILKGANPGELPVEQPTKLELIINRKTAKALGLEIPPELLLLADKVIE